MKHFKNLFTISTTSCRGYNNPMPTTTHGQDLCVQDDKKKDIQTQRQPRAVQLVAGLRRD